MKYFLLLFVILSISCCYNPCSSRGKLFISNIKLANGTVGKEYNQELRNAINLCSIVFKDDATTFPSGLDLKYFEGRWYLCGIPPKADEFTLEVIGTEFGTQCSGRSDEFKIYIMITDPKE